MTNERIFLGFFKVTLTWRGTEPTVGPCKVVGLVTLLSCVPDPSRWQHFFLYVFLNVSWGCVYFLQHSVDKPPYWMLPEVLKPVTALLSCAYICAMWLLQTRVDEGLWVHSRENRQCFSCQRKIFLGSTEELHTQAASGHSSAWSHSLVCCVCSTPQRLCVVCKSSACTAWVALTYVLSALEGVFFVSTVLLWSWLLWNAIAILNVYGSLQMGLSFNNNIVRCLKQKKLQTFSPFPVSFYIYMILFRNL